jgi:hypothetical protein
LKLQHDTKLPPTNVKHGALKHGRLLLLNANKLPPTYDKHGILTHSKFELVHILKALPA